MRCLMCGKNRDEGTFRDLFDPQDPLCEKCRSEWHRKQIRFRLGGVLAESSYVYNEAFSRCLIQFKELNDEALKDVFLYEVAGRLRFRYRGYTLCLLPSSEEKSAARGFSHLRLMFACLKMPMIEPFRKVTSQDQKHLNREERLAMQDAIILKDGVQLPEKILLCDDIITTGATMLGALAALGKKAKKVRIYAVSANIRWL